MNNIEVEKDIKKIEEDVIKLSETMNELHNLVNEQSQSIQTLEDFIQSSKTQTEKGHEILDKTENYSYLYPLYIAGAIASIILFL